MKDSVPRGIACIVASAFGFAAMAFFVRLADDFGEPLSCFQKGFFRNAIAFAIALAVFLRGRPRPVAGHGVRVWLTLLSRCLLGTVGIFANFYAISHIPLGEAMTLNKTAPFFAVLGSWALLGERASRRQIACLAVAFLGVMCVVRPEGRLVGGAAAWIGLAGGICAGLAYTCVHVLGKCRMNGSVIVLAFSTFSTLASLPFMWASWRPMTLAQLWVLLGAGAGAAIGQFGITAAYRYAEPRKIAAFDYTGVVFSALFGFAAFGQVPDPLAFVGFVLILGGAMFL